MEHDKHAEWRDRAARLRKQLQNVPAEAEKTPEYWRTAQMTNSYRALVGMALRLLDEVLAEEQPHAADATAGAGVPTPLTGWDLEMIERYGGGSGAGSAHSPAPPRKP